MTAITGSAFFPGGLGTYTAPANTTLTFEKGPSQTIQLQWGTYYDAADQAGLSRLWGGIHVSLDDLTGRRTGSQCGQAVWALARQYFDGSIAQSPVALVIRSPSAGQCELRCNTIRGFYYKLQTTRDLSDAFTDDASGFVQALNSPILRTDTISEQKKFYHYMRALMP